MHELNVVPLKPIGAGPRQRLGAVELGSFRLEEVMGWGSHGTTYLATQLGFERRAVVKVAHAELFDSRDAELVRRRFGDELRAATRVAHPNLVTLLAAGETAEGLPVIAMELVAGDPLEDLLVSQRRGLPRDLLEPAFAQLASALVALHDAGVVHGGLSPRNVLLEVVDGSPPKIKVLDHGVAMLRRRSKDEDGMVPATTAPEQIIGRVVPASDVFAMGAILWWALTGQEYRNDTLTFEDLQQHELEGDSRADPRAVRPDLPARISRLVGDLLAYSEHERPTAEGFLAAWPEAVAELRSRPARRVSEPLVPPPPPTRGARPPVPSRGRPPLSTRPRIPSGEPVRTAPRPAAATDVSQPRSRADSVSAPPTYDSLPVVGARPSADVRPAAGPRVLVVDANAVTQHLLVGFLRRHGCRVHGTGDPREATRSLSDDYDLVVLSTEIPDADPMDVARYLQEYHPEQWVVLAGTGTPSEPMSLAGVRELVPVPTGLPRLGELVDILRGELALREKSDAAEPDAIDRSVLDALGADDPTVVQETIEVFVGQAPDVLASIAEGLAERDAKLVRDACRSLSASARALGGSHLSQIAHTAAELARNEQLERVPGLLEEMEREYGAVFRALMELHAASMQRTGRTA